jgi:YVTN family beta-propeller protein
MKSLLNTLKAITLLIGISIIILPTSLKAAPYLYVANPESGNGALTVIDLATRTITSTIDAGHTPWALTLDPNNETVYVLDKGNGQALVVIDAATNQVVNSITLDIEPDFIAVHPSGESLYLSDNAADETGSYPVVVFDTETLDVTATILLPHRRPCSIALSPSGSTAYVGTCSGSDDQMFVIDTLTNSIVDVVPVGQGPEEIIVSPDGSTVYVMNSWSETVMVFDSETLSLQASIPLPHYPVDIVLHPDGSSVYASSFYGNALSIIDTTTEVAALSVLRPKQLAIHPDGHELYVHSIGQVAIIDTETVEVSDYSIDIDYFALDMVVLSPPCLLCGSVTGVSLSEVHCLNQTTQQELVLEVAEGARSWNCTSGDFPVDPTDQVDIRLIGTAR